MITMSNLYPNSEQPEDEVSSYFSSYIDDKGELLFACGWGDLPVDLENFALLLFNISTGQIIDKVKDDIRRQCMEAGQMEEFAKFENYWNAIHLEGAKENNDIVVRPLSVEL